MLPTVGQTLCGGRFRVVAEAGLSLGSRAFGSLLRAEATDVGSVWLSIVDAQLLPTPSDRSHFCAVARAMLDASDPRLVPMLCVDEEADGCVVVYEDTPGVHARTELDTPRDVAAVESFATEVARGLALLHRDGRCHGALCPGSVWILDRTPRLVQYGLAALCDPERWSTASHDLDFVAPEVLRGTRVDACADVFAWGVLVSGLLRRAVSDPRRATRLSALARQACASAPHRRPPDAIALLAELERTTAVTVDLGSAGTSVPEDDLVSTELDGMPSEPDLAWERIDTGSPPASGSRAHQLDVIDEADPLPIDPRLGWSPPVTERFDVRARTRDATGNDAKLELDRGAVAGGRPPFERLGGPAPRVARATPTATHRSGVRGRALLLVVVGAIGAVGALGWLANRSRRQLAANRLTSGLSQAGVTALGFTPPEARAAGIADAPPSPCPEDMAIVPGTLGSGSCIEIGEYPGWREIPQTGTTHADAEALCEARGRRLCTRAEWARACAGPTGERTFMYGAVHERERCNEGSAAGVPQNLARTGARERCVSPEGVYDLLGNAAEWVKEGRVMGGDARSVRPTCGTEAAGQEHRATSALGFRCCLGRPLPIRLP